MATINTIDDYLALVTSEHRQKPKFESTLRAIIEPMVKVQDLICKMPEYFDVDLAIGKQLDIVGEWVGISRQISIPLVGYYFTWDDTDADGWDSGVWQGEFDPDTGLISLNDDLYRIVIKGKIAANHWDGSIPRAYEIWQTLFPDSTIVIQDNQDMSMIVGIAGNLLTPVYLALLTGGYISLKPEGVGISYYAISAPNTPLFAWDSEGIGVNGWDIGSWAEEITP
jgi:hypothetical protein